MMKHILMLYSAWPYSCYVDVRDEPKCSARKQNRTEGLNTETREIK